jgi:hypothetical protein
LIPFSTSPSVMFDATCSHGPYLLGGVRHEMEEDMAIFIY